MKSRFISRHAPAVGSAFGRESPALTLNETNTQGRAGVLGKVFRQRTPSCPKTANGNKNISPQRKTGEGREKYLLQLPSGSRAEGAES